MMIIGLIAIVLLALIYWEILRFCSRPGLSASSPTEQDIAPHSHHIHGCQLVDGEWKDIEELRNGMHQGQNAERVKWFLSQGPEFGIRWHDGHVEAGSHRAEPLLNPSKSES